jgi:hypothetical protein
MILEEAIDVPLFFTTTYEGSDWSSDAHKYSDDEQSDLYFLSELQRATIGRVCRSWRIFSRSRRSRAISLESRERWLVESGPKACHVSLGEDSMELSSIPLPQGDILRWKIIRAYNASLVASFSCPNSLPRLRRLHLWFADGDPHFFDLLYLFPKVTWLDCRAAFFEDLPTIEEETNGPPVLPDLQVLRYQNDNTFTFPLSEIFLPSLRYLYMVFSISIKQIPLVDILLFYSQSIESVAVRMANDSRKVQTIDFPPWDQFPRLKELDLDRQWPVRFKPLPPSHPLQKLSANHTDFEAIPTLLEGKSMRKLTLQKARWTRTGELVGRTVMGAEKAAELWERAKARGVQFEVTQKGRKLQDRDEVLATSRVTLG